MFVFPVIKLYPCHLIGILSNASESLFAYNIPGQSFETFQDPSFRPAFKPVFDDPQLEQRANEICGGDEFCRFDIAATKNEEIGMATMQGVSDFDDIVELAKPSKKEMHIVV